MNGYWKANASPDKQGRLTATSLIQEAASVIGEITSESYFLEAAMLRKFHKVEQSIV